MICSRSTSFFSHQSGSCCGAEVLDRLAGAGQVVELAALHRLLDLQVDPLVLVLHPLGRGGRCAVALVRSGVLASGPVSESAMATSLAMPARRTRRR